MRAPQQTMRAPQQTMRVPQQTMRVPQQTMRVPQLGRPTLSTQGASAGCFQRVQHTGQLVNNSSATQLKGIGPMDGTPMIKLRESPAANSKPTS